jgi:hypothetical protein
MTGRIFTRRSSARPFSWMATCVATLTLAACGGTGGGALPQAQTAQAIVPQAAATTEPTTAPTTVPTTVPTTGPLGRPTTAPTTAPTTKPTTAPTTAPTSAPTAPAVPSGSGTVVWQAGSATLGKWQDATTFQCGSPVQSGSSFTFALAQGPAPGGGDCGRNQAQPLSSSGGLSQVVPGNTYEWAFTYIDGTPSDGAPGMGLDCHSGKSCGDGDTSGCPGTNCADGDARSTVWQIHGDGESNTPCTTLGFANGSNGVSSPQVWSFMDCGTSGGGNAAIEWSGAYTPQETDNWVIVVNIESTATGSVQLYRNGTLVYSKSNIQTYTDSPSGNPWWNFGIYKWIWETQPNDSSMSAVNDTVNGMTVYQCPCATP